MTEYHGVSNKEKYYVLYKDKFELLCPSFIIGYKSKADSIFDLKVVEGEMRPMIRYIKEHSKVYKKDLIGVEIGIQHANNSISILNELPMKQLYMVDVIYHTRMKEDIMENDKLKDKATFIHKDSMDAIDDIPDDLDFVYLDGSSEKDIYYRDIIEYYKKVRSGGVIGGQLGWANNPGSANRYAAIKKYVLENKFKVNFIINEFPTLLKGGVDWWMVKE